MDFVLAAIKTKYDANATLAALAPLYGKDEIDETTPFPYVTYFSPSIGPGGEIFSGRYEDVLIQFSIWSESRSKVEVYNIFTLLDNEFNNSSLTYTAGYYSRNLIRVAMRPPIYEEKAWHLSADYQVLALAKQS